jgi:Carbamate kinase
MKNKIAVIALGHIALGNTLPEQMSAVRASSKAIVDIIEKGYQVVISHSNAPQVGMIHTAMNEFQKQHDDYTVAPMSVCSAMSQGYIGYDLQNAIRTELLRRGIYRPVSTILTQVIVDPYDDAFYEPVKVIGRYMTEAEAKEEEAKGNYVVKEEQGYRRIISAPKPQEIVELDAIKALINANQVVIAGGGGIPVLKQGITLQGASAVIEKDLTAGRIAEGINADILIFLTSVENVYLNFNTDNETPITQIKSNELKKLIDNGQFPFAAGSMLPKLEASIKFTHKATNRKAIITSLDNADKGINCETGTIITS